LGRGREIQSGINTSMVRRSFERRRGRRGTNFLPGGGRGKLAREGLKKKKTGIMEGCVKTGHHTRIIRPGKPSREKKKRTKSTN